MSQLPVLPTGPKGTTMITVLGKIEMGTEIIYTRRGLTREYSGTLELVLADAIVVRNRAGDNVIIRTDAIDTIQLLS